MVIAPICLLFFLVLLLIITPFLYPAGNMYNVEFQIYTPLRIVRNYEDLENN